MNPRNAHHQRGGKVKPTKEQIKARLVFTLAFIGLLLAVLLSGCATDHHAWWRHGDPLPYKWVDAGSAQAMRVLCKRYPTQNNGVAACAKWDYVENLCVIIAQEPEASSPAWLREHEIKHCKGWSHP